MPPVERTSRGLSIAPTTLDRHRDSWEPSCSEPNPACGAERAFAQPTLFVVNPDGRTQVISVSNAPFARPVLEVVLDGLKSTHDKHARIHGTAG